MALHFSYLSRLNLKYIKITHSLKTALTIGLGYLLTLFLQVPSSQWILVTVIVVMSMQTTIGSFVKKSYARFLGTLLGALFGTIAIVLWPNNAMIIGFVLVTSTMAFTYFSFRKDDLNVAGVLGMVTVIMIVMANPPTISNALYRVMDVFIGILLSAIVIFLVLPTFAQNLFIKNLAPLLKDLSTLFHKSFFEEKRRLTDQYMQTLDASITEKMLEQKKLLKDAEAEWPKKKILLKGCREISNHYFKIHRHLNFMEYYFHASDTLREALKNQQVFCNYCQQLYEYLRALSEYIDIENKKTSCFTAKIPSLEAFKKEFFIKIKTTEENINLMYAFLLSADRLAYHLQELQRLFFEL